MLYYPSGEIWLTVLHTAAINLLTVHANTIVHTVAHQGHNNKYIQQKYQKWGLIRDNRDEQIFWVSYSIWCYM